MGLFRKRKNQPSSSPDMVDFDQDIIPIGDTSDPTSLLMTLTMRAGVVSCRLDESTTPAQWEVRVGERLYRSENQKRALQAALDDC